jgi:regulatory subunit for Cdc7p protein kinase
MATINRRPLANRSASFSKRPRSPDTYIDPRPSLKRVKTTASTIRPSTKDRKHAERGDREQQKVEFKEKFTRAFPTFTFCFDIDNVGPVDSLVSMIRQLGGV